MIQSTLSPMGISGITYSNKSWCIDSTTCNHMTSSPANFYTLSSYDGLSKVDTADGSSLDITRIDNIHWFHSISLNLNDVFLPKLSTNLISIDQLIQNNCNISFSPTRCLIQDLGTGKLIRRGHKDGWLFTLFEASHNNIAFSASKDDSNKLWTLWHIEN